MIDYFTNKKLNEIIRKLKTLLKAINCYHGFGAAIILGCTDRIKTYHFVQQANLVESLLVLVEIIKFNNKTVN